MYYQRTTVGGALCKDVQEMLLQSGAGWLHRCAADRRAAAVGDVSLASTRLHSLAKGCVFVQSARPQVRVR